MYTIMQGESLRIPATVEDKSAVSNLIVQIKKSVSGSIPGSSAPVISNMTVSDYSDSEITDGYLFSLLNTTVLTPGLYYINYSYSIGGGTALGVPIKLAVNKGVI